MDYAIRYTCNEEDDMFLEEIKRLGKDIKFMSELTA